MYLHVSYFCMNLKYVRFTFCILVFCKCRMFLRGNDLWIVPVLFYFLDVRLDLPVLKISLWFKLRAVCTSVSLHTLEMQWVWTCCQRSAISQLCMHVEFLNDFWTRSSITPLCIIAPVFLPSSLTESEDLVAILFLYLHFNLMLMGSGEWRCMWHAKFVFFMCCEVIWLMQMFLFVEQSELGTRHIITVATEKLLTS